MNVLVVAPHADDEILGCGATIAKYVARGDKVYICIATRPSEPIFKEELYHTIRAETIKAHKYLGIEKTFFLEFPAVMLENVSRYELNNRIQQVIQKVEPDEVYIPHFGDMQKDHQIISEATMVAVRPKSGHKVKKVFAYETLSETEWNIPHCSNTFIPNVYHDISDYLDKKIEAMRMYRSQLSDFPNPRSLDAITSLAKYRGSTVLAEAAEAFMLIREIR